MPTVISGDTGVDKVVDGSIGTVDLADGAVTGAKLANGVTDGSNADAGKVGEYVEALANNVATTGTGQYFDAASISLTAGDWDVSVAMMCPFNSSTYSGNINIGVSLVSGNSGLGLISGDNWMPVSTPTSANDGTGCLPRKRLSLTTTTTVYLKTRIVYSSGTPVFYGRISARRVR